MLRAYGKEADRDRKGGPARGRGRRKGKTLFLKQ